MDTRLAVTLTEFNIFQYTVTTIWINKNKILLLINKICPLLERKPYFIVLHSFCMRVMYKFPNNLRKIK